ncbi:MAG: amidohydrolase family protein, partial [Bacillota bacterium]
MGRRGFDVIDVHTHILPPEIIARAEEYQGKDEHFGNLAKTPGNRYATADDLILEMDRTGVSMSVTFGFAFRDAGACREVNDYIAASVARYPDRLVGFMCVNPLDAGVEREVSRCVSAGLRGV